MLAYTQQLNLTAHAQYFITPVKINSCRFIAMVDSGATGNFMFRSLVKRKEYSTQRKSDVYNLIVVDGNLLPNRNRRVKKEIKLLSIAIQQYYKKLIFNIVRMATYNIVLRIS